MKYNLKTKVTLWYTGMIALLVVAISFGNLLFAERYIVQEARKEIRDEVTGFTQELQRANDVETKVLRYYDDGVILSVYNDAGRCLAGYYPDEFPIHLEFENDIVRSIKQTGNYWIILDRSIEINEGIYWVRGIYALDLLEGMIAKVLQIWILLSPMLLLGIGYLGYRMLKHMLNPINHMIKMADDITKSNDLALRLPRTESMDELAYLSRTFNTMLDHLEGMFQRETQFTSDAAHELRTPISVISSHCEYCLEEMELDTEVREELLIISKKAQAMSELISQLLMIARAESGTYQLQLEETDMEIMAETIIDELQEKAEGKNIQINLENQMRSPVICCDANLMIQVITNLTDNAINYGRENGRIDIILSEEKDSCVIQVRDNGIGIAEEEKDKIWNRFYRVDVSHSKEKGFGLGLFMVRWIIELHGGIADVQSISGLGSIFTVKIPTRKTKR